jgi:hypothetical protein
MRSEILSAILCVLQNVATSPPIISLPGGGGYRTVKPRTKSLMLPIIDLDYLVCKATANQQYFERALVALVRTIHGASVFENIEALDGATFNKWVEMVDRLKSSPALNATSSESSKHSAKSALGLFSDNCPSALLDPDTLDDAVGVSTGFNLGGAGSTILFDFLNKRLDVLRSLSLALNASPLFIVKKWAKKDDKSVHRLLLCIQDSTWYTPNNELSNLLQEEPSIMMIIGKIGIESLIHAFVPRKWATSVLTRFRTVSPNKLKRFLEAPVGPERFREITDSVPELASLSLGDDLTLPAEKINRADQSVMNLLRDEKLPREYRDKFAVDVFVLILSYIQGAAYRWRKLMLKRVKSIPDDRALSTTDAPDEYDN